MRIVAPTYFQTPNDLVDHWLPKLGEAEVKILLVVFRKTFGWHKTRDRISLSQFQNLTGLTRANCCKAITSLIEKGILKKEIQGVLGTEEVYYELVVEDSNNSDQYCCDTPPSIAKIPTKEKLQKKEETGRSVSSSNEDLEIEKLESKLAEDGIIVCKASERTSANYATHIEQKTLKRWVREKGVKAVGRKLGSIIRSLRKNPSVKGHNFNLERYIEGSLRELG